MDKVIKVIDDKQYQFVESTKLDWSCRSCTALYEDDLCGKLDSYCDDGYFVEVEKLPIITSDREIPSEVTVKNKVLGKKYDSDKNRYDLVPANALDEVVKVLTYGAVKYNEDYDQENWRHVDHAKRRYFGALQRHIWAVKRGETHDPETGIHHYAHAMSNLMFLLEMELDPDYQSK